MLRVKKTYKLTSSDVATLKPLVRQENVVMLMIYLRFSGDTPEYSDRVWNQVIELRREFESRAANGLVGRRRSALLAARQAMERRMLAILVDDYIDFLDQYLDLSDWQLDEVSEILDWDRKRKEAAVNRHLANLPVLYAEVGVIGDETERDIKKLLTAEQLKDFRLRMEKGFPVTV